jgi:hypothetical protein
MAGKNQVNPVSIAALIVCSCICGIVGLPIYKVYVSAKVAAAKTAPLSNMRVVGVGLSMYAADYNDLYPPNFRSTKEFKDVLFPYIKNLQYFDSYNPNGSVLIPNSLLQSFDSKKVANPVKTVTFSESNEWPKGGKYYGFADIHAEFLKSVEGITLDPTKR